jgi:lysozyme
MLNPVVADMNHNNPVDFAKFAAAGGVGVIHKATQGSFVDPAYAKRREAALAAGLQWGGYDFNTGDPVKDQVTRFVQTAQPDFTTSLWLDFEDNRASQMNLAQAKEFLDRVDQILGRPCGIYSGNRAKELMEYANDVYISFFAAHPLWLCQYKIVRGDIDIEALSKIVTVPKPWTEKGWFLLQYTGDGIGPPPHTMPGLENGADLNVFGGTPDELRAAWSLAPVATPVTA